MQELTSDYHREVDLAFDDVSITPEEYEQLKDVDKSLLPLSQVVKVSWPNAEVPTACAMSSSHTTQMRCYELNRPLHGRCEQLEVAVTQLREQLHEKDRLLSNCQQV